MTVATAWSKPAAPLRPLGPPSGQARGLPHLLQRRDHGDGQLHSWAENTACSRCFPVGATALTEGVLKARAAQSRPGLQLACPRKQLLHQKDLSLGPAWRRASGAPGSDWASLGLHRLSPPRPRSWTSRMATRTVPGTPERNNDDSFREKGFVV